MHVKLRTLLEIISEDMKYRLFCEETFTELDVDETTLVSDVYHISQDGSILNIYIHVPEDY